MTSYYLYFALILGGIVGLFLLYYFLEKAVRQGVVYISNKDVDRMTGSVNRERETGGTIDQKPSKAKSKVTLERTGRDYGGRPGIIIRQESDDEMVWHSHPSYGHPYVDERNEVPSPEDISVLIKGENTGDVLVTPSKKVKSYKTTPRTSNKLRLREKIDPTGILLTRRLRGDMKKAEKQHPKPTVKDAKAINKEWDKDLDRKYGVELETERRTKSGVKIDDIKIKEEQ